MSKDDQFQIENQICQKLFWCILGTGLRGKVCKSLAKMRTLNQSNLKSLIKSEGYQWNEGTRFMLIRNKWDSLLSLEPSYHPLLSLLINRVWSRSSDPSETQSDDWQPSSH